MGRPPRPSRRAVLGALGAGLTAGCSALSVPADERTPTASPRTPGPFGTVAEPADWALPHHDSAHTRHAPERAAPDALAERWHRPLPTGIRPPTALAAADGRVILAYRRPRSSDDDRLRLVSLDAATGERVWTRLFEPWGSGIGPPYGPLPAVVGGMALFGHVAESGGKRLSALAAGDGAPQWSTPVDRGVTAVPAAGLLHVIRPFREDEPAEVAALDPLTGRTVWTRSFPDRAPRYPSFDGTDLFYPLYGRRGDGPEPPDRVAVLDPATGEERRRLPRSVQGFAPVGTGRLFSAAWASERLLAVDAATGKVDWELPVQFRHDRPDDEGIVNARYRFGGPTDDRLLVHEHLHGYLPDELRGLDPTTGEVRWTVSAGEDPLVQFNRPVVAGGTAYVGGTVRPHDLEARTGLLRAYDVATGALERSVELPSPTFVPPVVAGGRVFVVCQDGVRAIG